MGTPEKAQKNHGQVARLDEGDDREGPAEERGPAARARGQGGRRQEEDRHRRPVRRDEGRGRAASRSSRRRTSRRRRTSPRDARSSRRGGLVEVRPVMQMSQVVDARRASLPPRGGAPRLDPHAPLRHPEPRAGGRRRPGCLLPRAGDVEVPRRPGESRRRGSWRLRRTVPSTRCGASARRARFEPDVQRHIESEWTLVPTVEEAFSAGPERRAASHDVLVRPSRPARGDAGGADPAPALRLRRRARRRRRSSRTARRWRSASRGRRRCSRNRARSSTWAARRRYANACPPCCARSTSSSTRAITAHRPKRRCATSSAKRRFASSYLLVEHRLTSTPAGARARGALQPARRATAGPHGCRRQPRALRRAGPLPLGCGAHRSRPALLELVGGRRRAHRLPRRGGHRVHPRLGRPRRGHRLGRDRVALRRACMAIQPSPVVALNRAIAIAQRDGPARGLEEIARIGDRERLSRYPFYFAAMAEFERSPGARGDGAGELRQGGRARAQSFRGEVPAGANATHRG